jgi:hypothetical protein
MKQRRLQQRQRWLRRQPLQQQRRKTAGRRLLRKRLNSADAACHTVFG